MLFRTGHPVFVNVVVIDNVREVGDDVWVMFAWLENELFILGIVN